MEQQNTNKDAWYEKTWVVVLLCIIFFPVGLYALWKNSSISKGWKIGVTVLILLSAAYYYVNLGKQVAQLQSASSSTESSETESAAEPENEKQWTAVYTLKGNGSKKSPTFELSGEEARLKYTYNAGNNTGMGAFAVYVVDEGKDIMKTGGIPEVMSQAESEDSESALQKSAGRYYLNVTAMGNWEVTVEEMR